MKNRMLVVLCMLALVLTIGCTAQTRAKNFGGTVNIDLPAGQKLVNATWKEPSNLWYLTRPMHKDEVPETYEFKESSAFGLMQGNVIIHEH